MTLPSSGPLSFSQLQAEFGGSHPITMTEYRTNAPGLPATGSISLSDFYGVTYAPESDAFTIDPHYNDADEIRRYGFGRTGHTGFIHPEAGGGTGGFGSTSAYVNVMGGVSLMGIQVCDYANADGYYAVYDPETGSMRYSEEGSWKHITITGDASSANAMGSWNYVYFKFGGTSWTKLARSDHAYYRNHYDGSEKTFITWRPTNEFGASTPGFTSIYNNIKSAATSPNITFQVYFSLT